MNPRRTLLAGAALLLTLGTACGHTNNGGATQRCSILEHRLQAASADPRNPGGTTGLPTPAADQLARALTTYTKANTAARDGAWARWQPAYVAGVLADNNC